MADRAHSTPTSDIHPLTGSSARGRSPLDIGAVAEMPSTFVPLGSAAADVASGLAARRAATVHPDAEVIDLAERVKLLAARSDRTWDRRAAIEDTALKALPPRPKPEVLPPAIRNEDWRADGSNGPLFDPPDYGKRVLAAEDQYRAALAERQRIQTEIEASLGLPWWEKLAARALRRLARWTKRLATLEARTPTGLKAKAEAQLAIEAADGHDTWIQALATSVGRDAVRVATALADLPVAGIPFVADADPIIAMHSRAEALFAYAEREETSGADAEIALDEANALVLAAGKTAPTTPAGAVAALAFGLAEARRMQEQHGHTAQWDENWLGMLDGALKVFRAMGPASDADDSPLIAAISEFCRVDDLQDHLCRTHNADTDQIPGYVETEEPWRAWLDEVADRPALTWEGIVAKAETMKRHTVNHDLVASDSIGESMAEDILRLAGRTWDERSNRVPRSVMEAAMKRFTARAA